MGWVWRGLAWTFILTLSGCALGVDRDEMVTRGWEYDDQAVKLTEVARAHLGKRLGVPGATIRVQNVVPFVFPGTDSADTSQVGGPGTVRGYRITLRMGNLSHSYYAKAGRNYSILWREREAPMALPGGQLSLSRH
jgi:hypothetical protein